MKFIFRTLMILGILAYGSSSYAQNPFHFNCTTNNCSAGSYQESCTNCSMDGPTLKCDTCYKLGDTQSSATSLQNAQKCAKDIKNCEGTLVCGSVCCTDCGAAPCCDGTCCDIGAICNNGSCCMECGGGCCKSGFSCVNNNQCCNKQKACIGISYSPNSLDNVEYLF